MTQPDINWQEQYMHEHTSRIAERAKSAETIKGLRSDRSKLKTEVSRLEERLREASSAEAIIKQVRRELKDANESHCAERNYLQADNDKLREVINAGQAQLIKDQIVDLTRRLQRYTLVTPQEIPAAAPEKS